MHRLGASAPLVVGFCSAGVIWVSNASDIFRCRSGARHGRIPGRRVLRIVCTEHGRPLTARQPRRRRLRGVNSWTAQPGVVSLRPALPRVEARRLASAATFSRRRCETVEFQRAGRSPDIASSQSPDMPTTAVEAGLRGARHHQSERAKRGTDARFCTTEDTRTRDPDAVLAWRSTSV